MDRLVTILDTWAGQNFASKNENEPILKLKLSPDRY